MLYLFDVFAFVLVGVLFMSVLFEGVLLVYVSGFAMLLCFCSVLCLVVVHYMIMFVCCFVS